MQLCASFELPVVRSPVEWTLQRLFNSGCRCQLGASKPHSSMRSERIIVRVIRGASTPIVSRDISSS